jgi:hypothetical protein
LTERAEKNFSIEKQSNRIIFRTSSFSSEIPSVLHGDIYNREFASILAAMAIAVIVYMILVTGIEQILLSFIASSIVFLGSFVIFRTWIFKGRYLVALFDTAAGKGEIVSHGIASRRTDEFALDSISEISVDSTRRGMENPDGVAFVEKISAQHGVSIPGFGEETTLFMLNITLSDGRVRLIYADCVLDDVLTVQADIKSFLNI